MRLKAKLQDSRRASWRMPNFLALAFALRYEGSAQLGCSQYAKTPNAHSAAFQPIHR